jgi:hypothetical protein
MSGRSRGADARATTSGLKSIVCCFRRAASGAQTNGKIVYEITIVKGDSARKIVIDPASGQLVSG